MIIWEARLFSILHRIFIKTEMKNVDIVILRVGQGRALQKVVSDRPKLMVEINGLLSLMSCQLCESSEKRQNVSTC